MNYDFAERLIDLRRQHDLSQEDLAKDLGVSRQAISKWERAESTPDVTNLVALANLYKISLDELVHGENPVSLNSEASEPTTSESSEPQTSEPTTPPAAESADTDTLPAPEADAKVSSPPPPPDDAIPVQPSAQAPTPQQTKKRDPLYTFPYPVLIVMIYLFLGFCFGLWHPGWILFFTIPFYYWIVSVITRDPNYVARHQPPKR